MDISSGTRTIPFKSIEQTLRIVQNQCNKLMSMVKPDGHTDLHKLDLVQIVTSSRNGARVFGLAKGYQTWRVRLLLHDLKTKPPQKMVACGYLT